MDKILSQRQKFINHIIYSSMVFSLVYLFGVAINLELNISLQALMVLLISAIIKFFLLNPIFLYIILVIIFIATLLINHYFPTLMALTIDRIYFLFENIINYVAGRENIATENILLFWGMLIALISLFTGYIIFKDKKIYLLLPLYVGAFLYYWYVYFDEAYWMTALFFFLFFILVGLGKYYKTHSNFKETYTPWLKTIALYSFSVVMIALILPKSPNYIQWSWLQNKVYDIFPGIEDLRTSNTFSRGYGKASYFEFTTTGYQEETSRLGGPVRQRDKKVMTVGGDGPFYLRGNIKHTYTGNSWKSVDSPWEDYWLGEDFTQLPKNDRDAYYREATITITNHSFASTTLFSPYKPTEINFDGDYQIKVSPDEEIVLPQGIYSGESYTVKVLKPNSYDQLINLGIDRKKENIDNVDIYLQIPEDKITDPTRKLVKEIVKNSRTDLEKALAIEEHLRSNYKYNLDVERVPKNREFIDYFLFESKEGYCTYYATSMAIMLRLEDIPSRYVEGYLARNQVDKNRYEVRQRNAHAWVEAFIEPIGWVTFEPTPAYPLTNGLGRRTYSQERELEDSEATSYDVTSENLIEDHHKPTIDMEEDLENGHENIALEETPKDALPRLSKNTLTIFIGIVLLIISLKFLIRFLQFKFKEAKIKKLPNRERVIHLYDEIIKLTRLLGYSQEPGETHYEYADRIAYNFYYFGDKGIQDITETFVRNKYGPFPTSDEDVLEMERYKEVLERRLKNHLGLRAYYYGKYFKL